MTVFSRSNAKIEIPQHVDAVPTRVLPDAESKPALPGSWSPLRWAPIRWPLAQRPSLRLPTLPQNIVRLDFSLTQPALPFLIGVGGLAFLVGGLVVLPGAMTTAHGLLAAGGILSLIAVHLALRSSVGGIERQHLDKLSRLGRKLDMRMERLEDIRWELSESDARLRELLDSQDDIIARRDGFGRLTFVNRAFCRKFDVKATDVLGESFEPEVIQLDDQTSAPGEGCTATLLSEEAAVSINTVDGPRWVVWERHRIPHADGLSFDIQSVGRDVTEQRAAAADLSAARDEAEAANRAKSRFLAAMSHEIRTPMNGIMGMAGLLIDTPLTAEQKTYTQAIDQSARTLLTLIDEILDFSRIEAGRLELRSEPFKITKCVQDVVELLAPRAHAKQLELAWTVEPDVPAILLGDEARVRQILINLVGNAIKFTQRGGISIVVSTFINNASECGSNDRIRCTVTDTGIGLTAEAQARIFSEFERGETSPAAGESGTGLGLSIARKLARAMSGDITVESTQARGATFILDIKVPFGTNEMYAAKDTLPATAVPDVSGKRVLLAFDRLIERRGLLRMLEPAGVHVLEAADAVATAEIDQAIAEETPIDAIVIDAQADPVEAGQALQRLRTAAKALGVKKDAPPKNVQGIVLTTSVERANLHALEAVGYDRYLVRPVRPQSLMMQLLECRKLDNQGAADTSSSHFSGSFTSGPSLPSRHQQYQALRVLVAEDNDINALLAKALLTKLGCQIDHVINGREAIEAVRRSIETLEKRFDLILMDLYMPEVDGIAATKAIKRLHQDIKAPCPLIAAVTANAFEEDREKCLAAGMDIYVTKPFERHELEAILDRCLPPVG